MTDELKKELQILAEKYEVPSFCDEDPSQFLRWYSSQADIEPASFTAAMLAFGSRKQFIPKIAGILKTADDSSGSYSAWLKTKKFQTDFPRGGRKFYRFYSYDDLHVFFEELSEILLNSNTFGDFFRKKYEESDKKLHLSQIISQAFPESKIVPKGKDSANKRIHMFLRWMIRTGSPVDLGLWTWYSPENLLIPLDVHVMQEAERLGLIPEKSTANRKTAIKLTEILSEAFPKDPARADFALFGLGVSE